MSELLPDPFRDGLPDFDDVALNRARDEVVAGMELMRALVGADELSAISRGVGALDELELRQALLATVVSLRLKVGNRRL